jgi:organic hydroperoxide reductase OsmC/OhrA
VRLPGVKRTGVTPEELIAGAWVACFGATFIEEAGAREIQAAEVQYKASVVLEAAGGDYTITEANLQIDAPTIEPAALGDLIEQTHAKCPVSKLLTGGVANVAISPGAGTGDSSTSSIGS